MTTTTTYEPIELFIEESTVPNFDEFCADKQAVIDHLVKAGEVEPGRLVVSEDNSLIDTFRNEWLDTGIFTDALSGSRALVS